MSFGMTIGGATQGADTTFPVVDPATGEPWAECPSCSRRQLDEAFDAARRAQPSWAADEAARRRALAEVGDALAEVADELAPVLTSEQGKPRREAAMEFVIAGAHFHYMAGLPLPREVLEDSPERFVAVVRRPVGVVAAITPWNFPVALAAHKVAPALLAGNTVVLKPSPFTPLATLAMGEVMARALPPGVCNVVSGGDDLGAWMTGHPVPGKVSFTGSVATGRQVAASAAPDLKRVTLELGGNDPAIVLDDVDPGVAGPALFASAFVNNGQLCQAVKRIYVPEGLHDELVEALAACARAQVVGDGHHDDTDLGPVNNRPQFERVQELVADARSHGAVVASGGHALERPGYFFEPTILAGIADGVRVVDEEQFGPVLPVVAYRDVPEAVARANASMFGLSGSVWGTDLDRAATVASSLECGTVWVNTHSAAVEGQPFGGVKGSGLGRENGPWGLDAYTELQVVHHARSAKVGPS